MPFRSGIKLNHYFTQPDGLVHPHQRAECADLFRARSDLFDQDNDFDTKNAKAACYERYSGFWADFRGIYGTPGV